MNIPGDRRYTITHEWVRRESNGVVSIGITDHAQEELGDLVFIELPAVGRKVSSGEACAVVESVKAASDIYAPVDGEIVEANQPVADAPESVNKDAYANWLFKLKPTAAPDVDKLLDARGYSKTIGIEKA